MASKAVTAMIRGLGKVVRPFFSRQFVVFLCMGAVAAGANFLTGCLVRYFAPARPPWFSVSLVLAYTVGTIVSFVTNKFLTFRAHDQAAHLQFAKFILTGIVAMLLLVAVGWIARAIPLQFDWMAQRVATAENVAHVVGIGVTTIFNFVQMKWFTFRRMGLVAKFKRLVEYFGR